MSSSNIQHGGPQRASDERVFVSSDCVGRGLASPLCCGKAEGQRGVRRALRPVLPVWAPPGGSRQPAGPGGDWVCWDEVGGEGAVSSCVENLFCAGCGKGSAGFLSAPSVCGVGCGVRPRPSSSGAVGPPVGAVGPPVQDGLGRPVWTPMRCGLTFWGQLVPLRLWGP